ncbi:hypothetical protein WJX77_010339, partial [Trebouxia sp. C0004]
MVKWFKQKFPNVVFDPSRMSSRFSTGFMPAMTSKRGSPKDRGRIE